MNFCLAGVMHRSSQRVLVSAVRSFVEDLLRRSCGHKSTNDANLSSEDIIRALTKTKHFDFITNKHLGVEKMISWYSACAANLLKFQEFYSIRISIHAYFVASNESTIKLIEWFRSIQFENFCLRFVNKSHWTYFEGKLLHFYFETEWDPSSVLGKYYVLYCCRSRRLARARKMKCFNEGRWYIRNKLQTHFFKFQKQKRV